MINQRSLDLVDKAKFSKRFSRPLYQSYSFLQIPKAIQTLLIDPAIESFPEDVFGGRKNTYDRVVVLFIDGFGWPFFEKYQEEIPFLSKIANEAIVSKITSLFPSTTAAHVTCMHTGLAPNESSIYEWFIYEPSLNEIIAPLPYMIAGSHKPGDLDLDPSKLFPRKTVQKTLKELGIKSFAFHSSKIMNSPFTETMLSDAETIAFDTLESGIAKLAETTKNEKGYFMLYHGDIDAIGHRKGIHAPEFLNEIKNTFDQIEKLDATLGSNTALFIISDHGMVDVSPQKTYFLNEKIPELEKNFLLSAREKPLAPAGSCRDFFLHLREGTVLESKEILEHYLSDIAEVHLTEDLIKEGLFGPGNSTSSFLSKVGNLVILPYEGEAVWWREKGHFEQNFYAAHGGLTPGELHTPLFFKAYS